VRYRDLDDTSGCPNHGPCEQCGTEEDVYTSTFQSWCTGVFCLRLCENCTDTIDVRLDVLTTMNRVWEHCDHLGITVDEMADISGIFPEENELGPSPGRCSP